MFAPRNHAPFNALPPLPPKVELESKTVLRKVIRASRSLAHLNGAIRNLPNPNLFIDSIHLQEAKASSEIENIVTTHEKLYQSYVGEGKFRYGPQKEVINYKEALWLGFERLKDRPFITTNLCVEIVQCIKQNSAGIRVNAGTQLRNSYGEVVYTPPEGESVIRDKMAQLESFINSDSELDPLIKMALAHYQFEAIHPFADGNGRTGRVLLLLHLKMEGLLDVPVLFLSEYIMKHRNEYYRLLRGVTQEGDWESFVLYMLDMVQQSSMAALNRLNKIVELIETTSNSIKERLPKVYSKELMEVLFRLPYTKRQDLIDLQLGTPKTVGGYLKLLEEHGFLRSEKMGRERLYLNEALMKILEERSFG
ncbi:MAG: Fic/DOC family N-terminal domain-containing protein [Flavobacteriales bacterium]|nr:Fic/DOC family N-terminal domain-containing protein [Flavobacteriales bacterium]